jgi:hypothetical protein
MKKIITFLLVGMLIAPTILFAQEQVKVSPTPAKSEQPINVAINESVPVPYVMTLIRSDGYKLVVSEKVTARQTTIVIPKVAQGFYLLRLTFTNAKPITKKLSIF